MLVRGLHKLEGKYSLKFSNTVKPCILILCFVLGIFHYSAWDFFQMRGVAPYEGKTVLVHGRIEDMPKISDDNNYVTYTIMTSSLEDKDGENALESRLYITTSTLGEIYDRGNTVRFYTTLQNPSTAAFEGGFDYSRYVRGKGVSFVGFAKIIEREENVEVRYNPILDACYAVRESIVDFANKYFIGDGEAVLAGVMIGARSAFTDELSEAFKKTGIFHIVAVSGMHVNVFMVMIIFIFSKLGFRKRAINLIAIPILILFSAVSAFTASVLRAVIMMIIFLIAETISRESDRINSLFIAALILVIVCPYVLFEAGFLLSVGATLGLILYAEPISQKLETIKKIKIFDNRFGTFLVGSLAASISGMIGTVFFTAYFFNTISIGSIIVNVFVVPLVSVIFIGGFIIWGIHLIWQWGAKALSTLLWVPIMLVVYISKAFAQIPFLCYNIKSPGFGGFVIYLTLCTILYILLYKKTPQIKDGFGKVV